MRWILFCVCVLGMSLALTPAHALDDSTIDRWIASMEEVDAWSSEQGDVLEEEVEPVDDPADFDFERMMSEAGDRHAEVEAIVKRNGFDGVSEWAATGGRIFDAFFTLQMEGMGQEMEQQMEQARQQLEDDPNLTDQQKEQIRQQMEQQYETMSAFAGEVDEADLEAVRSKEAELRQLFEN